MSTKNLADEIQKIYDRNLEAIGKGGLDQRAYVDMIGANCTLLHAHALLKVADAIAEAVVVLASPVMEVDQKKI